MLEVKIKVFQKFFATKIQNPGGSSLTKVLTRDCLSLVHTLHCTAVYQTHLYYILIYGPDMDFGIHFTWTELFDKDLTTKYSMNYFLPLHKIACPQNENFRFTPLPKGGAILQLS